MTSKPDGEEDGAVTIGSNTRVTFVGVALLSLLAGICTTSVFVALGVERLNRNIEERPTRIEMYYWSLDAQRAIPGLPVFPPARKE